MVFRNLFILLLSILPLNCGYRLVGSTSSLPPHIKTIAVPLFVNHSKEPTIEKRITQMIRKEFINDGRLSVVDIEGADMILRGTLKEYILKPVAFDIMDNATEYWVIMKVEIEAIDTVKNNILLKEEMITKWDYRASSSVVSTESERMNAIGEASRDLAQRLISIIIEGF